MVISRLKDCLVSLFPRPEQADHHPAGGVPGAGEAGGPGGQALPAQEGQGKRHHVRRSPGTK